MTPTAQRIAIATACGWTVAQLKSGVLWKHPQFSPRLNLGPPDYVRDLNAMHEAERIKDLHHDQRWIEALIGVGLEASGLSLAKTDGWDWALVCARATAAQRAEAFLRTLNLWTP